MFRNGPTNFATSTLAPPSSAGPPPINHWAPSGISRKPTASTNTKNSSSWPPAATAPPPSASAASSTPRNPSLVAGHWPLVTFYAHSAANTAYLATNSPVKIHSSTLISLHFPAANFAAVYEITPKLSPVAMLNVSGVATSVTNAGNASVNSFQSTCAIDSVISAPTSTSAGAVANAGIAAATITLLNPVRAPAATPAALSM